jgi:copper(I)-binding protein
VSSGEQNLITRLRLLPAVLGIGAALLMSGCSAGQVTQTDTQVPAINGASGTVGQIAVRNVQLAFPAGKQYYSRGDSASLVVTIINTGSSSDKLAGITSPQFGSGAQIIGDPTIPSQHAIAASANKLIPLTTTATTTATSTTGTSTTGTSTTGTSTTGTSTTGTSTSGSASSSTSASSSSTSGSATSTSATATTTPSANVPVGSIQVVLVSLTLDKLQPGQTVSLTFTFASAGDLTLTVPIAADPAPRDNN